MNASRIGGANQLGFAVAALVIAIGGVLLPIPSYVELYQIPVDTACRPMGQAVVTFLCGIVTPLIVIALGILCWKGGRTIRLYGIAAMLLSLVPLPFYFFLFRWIVDSHHLVLEP